MEIPHFKYLIVGAGLSGLTSANELLKKGESDFAIFESRDRIGGRIFTKDGIDLGATWFQDHHTYLSKLLNELDLKRFPQRSAGTSVLVYNSMAPAHYFESDPNAPSAYRITGGSSNLIRTLAEPVRKHIKLSTRVAGIEQNKDNLAVITNSGKYTATYIILALPPKLMAAVDFEPTLPTSLITAMEETHTWMSNAIKVGISFKTPFWREKGFSGTIIGQIGPTIELYDHSNAADNTYSLMGFVNEGLRDESEENRKERILTYLEKHLGQEIRDYLHYEEKDWSQDLDTSAKSLKSVYISPRYGNPLLQQALYNERLWLSGAETSAIHGGYMDGAIYRAQEVVKQISMKTTAYHK